MDESFDCATTVKYQQATRRYPVKLASAYSIPTPSPTNTVRFINFLSAPLLTLHSSPQDASLIRLPCAYARHVQAGLQRSVIRATCRNYRRLILCMQTMAPSRCRHTSSTTTLVTSSTSKPMLPNRRVCLTNTTTGALFQSYHCHRSFKTIFQTDWHCIQCYSPRRRRHCLQGRRKPLH